jgi:hypothetical protein
MTSIPSVGDILLLSQLAWKIGRAFTAGRKGAPPEFLEVETEINGLAKALKLLAEALFNEADGELLRQADPETQHGVAAILASCQRTVHDLDSLMDQYQVIKKHRTPGGFAIERSWSDLVLAQYQTMTWTAEGGNIRNLRNMLRMHTSSLTLTMQALQRCVHFFAGRDYFTVACRCRKLPTNLCNEVIMECSFEFTLERLLT